MKRIPIYLKYRFPKHVTQISPLLFTALFSITATLLIYIFIAHSEILEHVRLKGISHQLSLEAQSLSEANYRTQLELYELFSSPSDKRYKDFLHYEDHFNRKFVSVYEAFIEHPKAASPSAVEKLNNIIADGPNMRSEWHRFVKGLEQKKSDVELRKGLIQLEEKFDRSGFDEEIHGIVTKQIEYDKLIGTKISQLDRQHNLIVTIVLVLVVFLSAMAALIHKAAIQGQSHELQLIQASKLASLGEMSAGVAHELNNPLMAVDGFNARIRSTLQKAQFPQDSPAWEYLDHVQEGADRMRKIISHFKDFSRLSDASYSLFELNESIKKSFILFEEQFRQHGIEVSMELVDMKIMVYGNSNRLQQVFTNLVQNSKDALFESSDIKNKKICIRTHIEDSKVLVEFEDNGPGIPKNNMSRIFDPFFTTKPMGKGTGLGLSVSQGIVRDHGGVIQVANLSEGGVRFSIILPVVRLERKGEKAS